MMLSDVCLSVAYIGRKSRTERPRKTEIGTEVAHVTRDSDTTFKVKRSRSPGRFTHRGIYGVTQQTAAAVSVGTYSPWEPTVTLRSARRHNALIGAHRGRKGARYIVAVPAQLVHSEVHFCGCCQSKPTTSRRSRGALFGGVSFVRKHWNFDLA